MVPTEGEGRETLYGLTFLLTTVLFPRTFKGIVRVRVCVCVGNYDTIDMRKWVLWEEVGNVMESSRGSSQVIQHTKRILAWIILAR